MSFFVGPALDLPRSAMEGHFKIRVCRLEGMRGISWDIRLTCEQWWRGSPSRCRRPGLNGSVRGRRTQRRGARDSGRHAGGQLEACGTFISIQFPSRPNHPSTIPALDAARPHTPAFSEFPPDLRIALQVSEWFRYSNIDTARYRLYF